MTVSSFHFSSRRLASYVSHQYQLGVLDQDNWGAQKKQKELKCKKVMKTRENKSKLKRVKIFNKPIKLSVLKGTRQA